MSKKGNDPREIADLIFKIINSKNPKIHYLSGKFIQKLVTLKEFIPDMRLHFEGSILEKEEILHAYKSQNWKIFISHFINHTET